MKFIAAADAPPVFELLKMKNEVTLAVLVVLWHSLREKTKFLGKCLVYA